MSWSLARGTTGWLLANRRRCVKGRMSIYVFRNEHQTCTLTNFLRNPTYTRQYPTEQNLPHVAFSNKKTSWRDSKSFLPTLWPLNTLYAFLYGGSDIAWTWCQTDQCKIWMCREIMVLILRIIVLGGKLWKLQSPESNTATQPGPTSERRALEVANPYVLGRLPTLEFHYRA